MVGMGYNPVVGADGKTVDCDLWSNLFNGTCWNPFAKSAEGYPDSIFNAAGESVKTALNVSAWVLPVVVGVAILIVVKDI